MIDWILNGLRLWGKWAEDKLVARARRRQWKNALLTCPLGSIVKLTDWDGATPITKMDNPDHKGVWIVVDYCVLSDKYRLVRPDGSSREAWAPLNCVYPEGHTDDWKKAKCP